MPRQQSHTQRAPEENTVLKSISIEGRGNGPSLKRPGRPRIGRPDSTGDALREVPVPSLLFQPLKAFESVDNEEDVFDIPDTSPEKSQKPSSRAARKPIQNRRGESMKAAPKRIIPLESVSSSEGPISGQVGSSQLDDGQAARREESPPIEDRDLQQATSTPPRQKRPQDSLTPSPPKRHKGTLTSTSLRDSASEPSPRRSQRLREMHVQTDPRRTTTQGVVEGSSESAGDTPSIPGNPQAATSELPQSTSGSPNDAIGENVPQELASEDANSDDEAADGTSDSASEQSDSVSERSDEPRFQCFGQYEKWVSVKEAASSAGTTENGDHRIRRVRAQTPCGKELLVFVRGIIGSCEKFKDFSQEEWHLSSAQRALDEVEMGVGDLEKHIQSIDAESLEPTITDLLRDVYWVMVPSLIHLLDRIMMALDPLYADYQPDEINRASLKIIIRVQSFTISLCQNTKAWKAAYARNLTIKDSSKTTRQILPPLRDYLKPAFEKELRDRTWEFQRVEWAANEERRLREEEERCRAQMDRIKLEKAELLQRQLHQLERNKGMLNSGRLGFKAVRSG